MSEADLGQQPTDLTWNYEQFSATPGTDASTEPPLVVPLVFESRFRGHGAMEAWTINGKSYPDTRVSPLIRDQRYRLQFINKSVDDHPLHLHRHSFELRTLGAPISAPPDAAPKDMLATPRPITRFKSTVPRQCLPQQVFVVTDLNVSPDWEINFGVGIGATSATDHLIVKAILGRRFDWGRHSPVD